MEGFCCARRSSPSEKNSGKELGGNIRVRLPWEAEPEKFNRETNGAANKFENKALVPKKSSGLPEMKDSGSSSNTGVDATEHALHDAANNLSKAKQSVSTAKEELERLRKKQSDLTKELHKIEIKKSENKTDDIFGFISAATNISAIASTTATHMQAAVREDSCECYYKRYARI